MLSVRRWSAVDDVDAAGVRAGDEARLLQDETEQLVDLALGGDGLGDLEELADLVAVAVYPVLPRLGALPRVQQLEGVVDGHVELIQLRRGLDRGAEAAVQRLVERARVGG